MSGAGEGGTTATKSPSARARPAPLLPSVSAHSTQADPTLWSFTVRTEEAASSDLARGPRQVTCHQICSPQGPHPHPAAAGTREVRGLGLLRSGAYRQRSINCGWAPLMVLRPLKAAHTSHGSHPAQHQGQGRAGRATLGPVCKQHKRPFLPRGLSFLRESPTLLHEAASAPGQAAEWAKPINAISIVCPQLPLHYHK